MLKRILFVLFVLALATAPLAEWKTFVLPVNGKVFGWDPSGFGSASFFDLIFLAFCALNAFEFFKRLLSRRLKLKSAFFLCPLIVLLAILPIYRPVSLPWMADLTPAPVGFRTLLQHVIVLAVMYYYVLTEETGRIVKWLRRYWIFSFGLILASSLVTLAGHPLFEESYPFQPRFTLVFPFWNQNLMAPFVSVSALGMCGLLLSSRKWSGAVGAAFALGILILSAGLTGSRSNLVLLSGCIVLLFAGSVMISPTRARRSFVKVLVGSAVGAALLLMNLKWEPVARSVSLFRDILSNPKVLIYGDPKGARGKIWAQSSTAIAHAAGGSGVATSQQADSEFSSRVSLVSVSQGCLKSSSSIEGLKIEKEYFLRLKMPGSPQAKATLEVFSDPERKQSLGKVEVPETVMKSPDVLLVGAKTGISRRQRFKFIFSDYKLIENGTSARLLLNDERLLDWNDLHYRHSADVQTGHLRLLSEKIEIGVIDNTMDAHVAFPSAVLSEGHDVELDYRFSPAEIGPSVEEKEPFVAVGIYEPEPRADWSSVKNGLFVRHSLTLDKRAESVVKHNKWRALTYVLGRTRFNRPSDDEARSELFSHYDCRGKKVIDFANLEDNKTPSNFWLDPSQPMPPIWRHVWGDLSQGNSMPSTDLEDDWSVSDYLAGGSSTLSVYRDWVVFAGKLPLLLFLSFILLLNGLTVSRAWKARRQGDQALILSILAIQSVFLSVYLYPQPFLFVKFYWITWAIAAGLAYRSTHEARLSS